MDIDCVYLMSYGSSDPRCTISSHARESCRDAMIAWNQATYQMLLMENVHESTTV